MNAAEFHGRMVAMGSDLVRYHWCGGDPSQRTVSFSCACCGCANGFGGFSDEIYPLWQQWVAEHPRGTVPERECSSFQSADVAQPRKLDPNRLPR